MDVIDLGHASERRGSGGVLARERRLARNVQSAQYLQRKHSIHASYRRETLGVIGFMQKAFRLESIGQGELAALAYLYYCLAVLSLASLSFATSAARALA